MMQQRGGFVLGMVVGLLIGLSLALGVALYITKAPMPFVNKVPPRTAEQDQAEAERNKNWDPNAPLAPKGMRTPPPPVAAASAPAASPAAVAPPASAPAKAAARDPAAILAGAPATAPASAPAAAARSTAGGVDPFVYFVQVGAFSSAEEAEQQRAKLALAGLTAKVSEREQSGRTVYRVRLGPFDKKDEADAMQSRLTAQSQEARLVRVERN